MALSDYLDGSYHVHHAQDLADRLAKLQEQHDHLKFMTKRLYALGMQVAPRQVQQ